MKAVLCNEFGPPENLIIGDAEPCLPGEGQVGVDMKAAGGNFADSLIINGKYQSKQAFPFSPGMEGAGFIREVGAGVTDFKVGDRVMVHPMGGGAYSQDLVIDTSLVFHIPSVIDFVTAGGFFITYGTSHHALKDRAQIKIGDTLVVLGAAGGVGLTAVELGKAMGARVIAAASTEHKLELCKKYGADETINYSKQDLRDSIKNLTDGKGADVIYDPVGGTLSEQAVRSLAPGGRLLVIGFAAGDIPTIPLNLVLIKRSAIIGVFFGNWVLANESKAKSNIRELLDWYETGKIKPYISKVFSMGQAAEAINHVVSRRVEGKVIISLETS